MSFAHLITGRSGTLKRLYDEIGSEFWEEDLSAEENDFFQQFSGDIKHMMSGRTATQYVLQELLEKAPLKKAYLPSYTCETVIAPFVKMGYRILFYDVDQTLMPLLDFALLDEICVFLFHGYFGFPLCNNEFLSECKKRGIFVLHDITHTMFSNGGISGQADYLIGSVRKWFGVAAGGFAVLQIGRFQTKPAPCDFRYIHLRNDAFKLKRAYMQGGAPSAKSAFQQINFEAMEYLTDNAGVQKSDRESVEIVKHFDLNEMVRKRRENFLFLRDVIAETDGLRPAFNELPDGVCPLYFPVFSERRDDVKKQLIQNDIYTPTHWPVPDYIDVNLYPGTADIYHTIFSIPCDQRYDIDDMNRIKEAIKCLK